MARYWLDLPEHNVPLQWDPQTGPRPERADTRYFGGVFRYMDAALDDDDLDVYLTWDVRRLPSYGPRVIAIVLGDEAGRVPAYLGQVLAVFKPYGGRPVLRSADGRGLTSPASAVESLLGRLRALPGELRARRLTAPVVPIPLGTYNQLDLPIADLADRTTDVFFAGSVVHRRDEHALLGTPKARTRRAMLASLEDLRRRRPALRIDVRLTAGFAESIAGSPEDYSRGLMDARICLAPRGTSLETFRVFEGLRYGCIVIANRLPHRPFYDGAPVVQLDRWKDLPEAVARFDDLTTRQRWHRDALAWWRSRCSEQVVGALMARRVNELSRLPRNADPPDRHPRAGHLRSWGRMHGSQNRSEHRGRSVG